MEKKSFGLVLFASLWLFCFAKATAQYYQTVQSAEHYANALAHNPDDFTAGNLLASMSDHHQDNIVLLGIYCIEVAVGLIILVAWNKYNSLFLARLFYTCLIMAGIKALQNLGIIPWNDAISKSISLGLHILCGLTLLAYLYQSRVNQDQIEEI